MKGASFRGSRTRRTLRLTALLIAGCHSGRPVHGSACTDCEHGPMPETDLNERLIRFYPDAERVAGQSGEATVHLTILRSGTVRDLRVIESSKAAFGESCIEMLADTRWSPATDKHGNPKDLTAKFVCTFVVTFDSPQRVTLHDLGVEPLSQCVKDQPGGTGRSPTLDRSIRVHFDETGRATDARMVHGDSSDAVDACLMEHAKTWSSPMRLGREHDITVNIP